MTSKLEGLIIESVDLCKKGANPDAKIVLFKRDANTKGDGNMPKMEDILEKLSDEEKGVVEAATKATEADVEKATKTAEELEKVTKAKEAADTELKGFKDAEEAQKKAEEDKKKKEENVLKDADPKIREYVEGLEKKIEKSKEDATETSELVKKSSERVEKLETDIKKAEYIKKASEFKGLAIKPEELGETLMNLAKSAPEEMDKVMEVLKSADAVILENATIMKAMGADGEGEPGTSEQEMEKKAHAIAKAKDIPYEQAYDDACKSDTKLYAKIQKGE